MPRTAASTNRVVRKNARIGKEQWRGIERPGADLEQERRHQQEVVPAHEDDLDVRPAFAKPLQAAGRGHSSKAAAEDHDLVF